MVKLREIECKSILFASGSDYSLNCYVGCEHNCVYCYARFMKRFTGHREAWGEFVDARINAPEILRREIKKVKPLEVFVSRVCDGWQPLEEKYQLTRECLKILRENKFPIRILTKSNLVIRDLSLLEGYEGAEVGVTITTMDENLRLKIEPFSSSSRERLEVLEKAKSKGLKIWAMLGPLMPFLSDNEENIKELMKSLSQVKVDYFYVDRLNPRPGVWPSVKQFLQVHYPDLTAKYVGILYNERIRAEYSHSLRGRLRKCAALFGLLEKLRCF